MPIKVLIMVIERRCSAPTFTQAPKGDCVWRSLPALWLACFTNLSILACEPWYYDSRFYRWCLASYLGAFRSYIMHAELVPACLTIRVSVCCGSWSTARWLFSFKIPRRWLVVSARASSAQSPYLTYYRLSCLTSTSQFGRPI
jgi:hypothetical protein